MSEEIHEESTINSCLQLLDGKKDEEKIAGLLMAAKYCKPSVFLIYSISLFIEWKWEVFREVDQNRFEFYFLL